MNLFRALRAKRSPFPDINNIILFGETGCGKSSIINMLLGDNKAAQVSSAARGCTFKSKGYSLDINEKSVTLWDTVGLDEGDGGRLPKAEAIVELYKLLRRLPAGVGLLVFVMRAPRIKETTALNWKFFRDIICQGKVPSVIVITGLEGEVQKDGDTMSRWWRKNEKTFTDYGIIPQGNACITATRGRPIRGGPYHVYDDLYEKSRKEVQDLIKSNCSATPLQIEPVTWFKTVVQMTVEAKTTCWTSRLQIVMSETTMIIDEAAQMLKEQCGMKEADVRELTEKMSQLERCDSRFFEWR